MDDLEMLESYKILIKQAALLKQKMRFRDFVSHYQAVKPGRTVLSSRLSWVCVVDIKPLTCQFKSGEVGPLRQEIQVDCQCSYFWTFIDEPDLFRCAQCCPRPQRATLKDIRAYSLVCHLRAVDFSIRADELWQQTRFLSHPVTTTRQPAQVSG